MVLILHQIESSPPVRAVKLCLAELGLQAEYKLCKLLDRDHLTPEYLKKNPQHTVPTLEDGDLIIWDSHAINAYLVATYGKSDALYPSNPRVRALIDQRLHFDSGVLFPALKDIAVKIIREGAKSISEKQRELGREALQFVESFLEGRKFISGESYNIADFSVYTSASSLVALLEEADQYPNLKQYLARCKSAFKGIEQDNEALQGLVTFIHQKLSE